MEGFSNTQTFLIRLLSFCFLLREMAHGLMIRHSIADGICLQQHMFVNSKTKAGQIREPLKTRPYPLYLQKPKCAWLNVNKAKSGSALTTTVTEMTCQDLGQSTDQGRIVNGTESPPDAHPSYVRLQIQSTWNASYYSTACGATIIDKNWAITAKHCGKDKDGEFDLQIVSGRQDEDTEEEGEQVRLIDRRIEHPNNNTDDPTGKKIDLLLLHWEEPLTFGAKAQPAPLFSEAKESGELTLVGTGLQDNGCSPCEIREATIPIISDDACNKEVADLDLERWLICVQAGYPKTGCFGDSGGPMFTIDEETGTQTLTGVIAFGTSKIDSENPCFKPDIFTAGVEVYWFLDWIQENIKT